MLLPEPVSPMITTTGFLSTVSNIFSSDWRIGRFAIIIQNPNSTLQGNIGTNDKLFCFLFPGSVGKSWWVGFIFITHSSPVPYVCMSNQLLLIQTHRLSLTQLITYIHTLSNIFPKDSTLVPVQSGRTPSQFITVSKHNFHQPPPPHHLFTGAPTINVRVRTTFTEIVVLPTSPWNSRSGKNFKFFILIYS